jgi:hypothetical protein
MSLLFGRTIGLPPLPGRPPDYPSLTPAGPPGPVPWIELMRSIVFWAVFLAILGFSVYFYLRQRADLLSALGRLPGWHWLMRFWHWLGGGVSRFNANMARAIRLVTNRRRTTERARWDYVGLRRLSPRDQVRFYYLALVRRATEAGLPRRPAQTPLEYQNNLSANLTAAHDDLELLTGAYMEARYSQHAVSRQTANLAHDLWERLKRALRALRQ